MNERCLVIGGGIAGMLTARQLHDAGYQVTVADRGKTGQESSWAAGGILSPMYPWHYPDAITELFLWSAKRYLHFANELAEESGIDPEWVQSGMLIFDTDEKHQAMQWAKTYEVSLEILPNETIVQGEPRIAPPTEEALWLPEIAQIRPPRLMKSLRKSLEKRKIPILDHTEIKNILVEHGQVTGVESQTGKLVADRIVVAGGAWSSILLEPLGYSCQVEPVRGQMILYKAEPGWLSRMIQFDRRYLIPRRDGRILVGSTVEFVGFKKETTQEGIEILHQTAIQLMPCLENCPLEHQWAGLRPGKKDHLPLIGPHPSIKGLYIHTGHFRNGIVLSLATSHLLTCLITNKPTPINPAPFLP